MPDEQDVILVDLSPAQGMRGMNFSATSPDLREKSQEVVDKAMGTIRAMAAKVVKTVKEIKVSERPNKVEVQFGIKFDAEAGALVAKASTETAIAVTLTWEHKETTK
mgnify:CR=1 FL=1